MIIALKGKINRAMLYSDRIFPNHARPIISHELKTIPIFVAKIKI
jgi:hypothetical protein